VKKEIDTNEVYIKLMKVRISNFISELYMLGLISAREEYRGRYGHTRVINPNLSEEKMQKIMEEDYRWSQSL